MAKGISIEGRGVEGDIMDMKSSKHRISPFILEKETPEQTAYNYLIKFPSGKLTNMRVDENGSQMHSQFVLSPKKLFPLPFSFLNTNCTALCSNYIQIPVT